MMVAGPITGAVAAAVWIGTIEAGAEPRSAVPSIASPTDSEVEGPGRIAQTETPAVPGVPSDVETPCGRPGVVVIGAVPGVVVITGPIDHTAVGDIRTGVTRGVADINDLGRRLVDLDVGDVVVGI